MQCTHTRITLSCQEALLSPVEKEMSFHLVVVAKQRSTICVQCFTQFNVNILDHIVY